MTKQVKVNKNVHDKLLYLKKKTNAKSINDVIISLIQISEEYYTTQGTLNVENKEVLLRYDKYGKLVEIKIRK